MAVGTFVRRAMQERKGSRRALWRACLIIGCGVVLVLVVVMIVALVAWPATRTRRKGSSAGQTGTRGAIAARLSVGAAGQGRGTHATRGSTHQGSALVLARIATIARRGDALNDLLHAAITCTVYYMLSITWPITCRSCYMRASRFKQPLHACNGCM